MNKLVIVTVLATALTACNPQEPVIPPAEQAAPAPAPASPEADQAAQLSVVNWGQKSTPAEQPFNVQADGNSGISFELAHPAPQAELTAEFDGKPLTGVVVNGVIVTATIPGEYLAKPGHYPVVLRAPSIGAEAVAGEFEVTAHQ